MIEVHSDGSGTVNKPGGYGWVIVDEFSVICAGSGGLLNTTNNVMELSGAIEGLKAAKAFLAGYGRVIGEKVFLVGDSEYMLGIASGKYRPKKNLEYAQELRALARELDVTTRWVRGHSYNRGIDWKLQPRDSLLNHRCDRLAHMARMKYEAEAHGSD